jgi:hypothetical protein
LELLPKLFPQASAAARQAAALLPAALRARGRPGSVDECVLQSDAILAVRRSRGFEHAQCRFKVIGYATAILDAFKSNC